eukprot:COSAG01_NODE_1637_length_9660_cov_7.731932_9_plen_153_part_00
MLDAFDFLPRYKDMQLQLMLDNSSGHNHGSVSGALNVASMNGGYGGDQSAPRTVKLRAKDIGDQPALQEVDGRMVDVKLQAGEEQCFTYGVGDLPPFNKPDAPRKDFTDDDGKIHEGFEGKPKGTLQICFESGHWYAGCLCTLSTVASVTLC